MVLLLGGGTHTGKTVTAQRLLERYHWPYLSLDHLKMGLIRSGLCPLTPESPEEELTGFLWPIAREMVKTAVENRQNLMVEGCYLPFDWKADFPPEYLEHIRAVWLIFSARYIQRHQAEIQAHANDVEHRLRDEWSPEELMEENRRNLEGCRAWGCRYVLIDDRYEVPLRIEDL